MSQRKEFVLRALQKDASIAELCRQYGVSRKTAYKWLSRFRKEGVLGLVDGSRRPLKSPARTVAQMRADIIAQKQAHPKWGPKKLRMILLRKYGDRVRVPCTATIERVLRAVGMIGKPRRRRPSSAPRTRPSIVADAPNVLWTVDFKGWWRTDDGKRCDPLTVRDAFSRKILALKVMPSTREEPVRKVFEDLFRRFGLPKAIQSDNGTPFVSASSLLGLTRLSAWWIDLGIDLVRSRPGCPQDNGGHERMHLDVCLELEDVAAATLEAQQAAFDQWVAEFNNVRPHEALGMRTPAEVYVPSARRMPTMILTTYPSHMHTHRVDTFGHIYHRRNKLFVSSSLAHRLVAVEELEVGGRWLVWFCDLLLGGYVYRKDDRVYPLEPDDEARALLPGPGDAGRRVASPPLEQALVRSTDPRAAQPQ